MAAINVAGVRGDPCGAVRWTAVQGTASIIEFLDIFTVYSTKCKHNHDSLSCVRNMTGFTAATSNETMQ